jgi:hypothetical protein
MISLLIGLLLLLPIEQIYGPGAMSYADLDAVVARKGWEGTRDFDVLSAPSNCNLMARQGWLITSKGVFSTVIVDCQADEHKGQMEARGLLVDTNRDDLVGANGWLIVR